MSDPNQSGEYPALPHCAQEHGKLKLWAVIGGGGAAVSVAVAVIVVCWTLTTSAVARADAAVTRVEGAADASVAPLRAELKEANKNTARFRSEVLTELHEVRLDVRAAERSSRTGQKQERLERAPDPPAVLDSGSTP